MKRRRVKHDSDLLNRIKLITGPMRVPFLLLAPVCVLLGTGTALGEVGHISLS